MPTEFTDEIDESIAVRAQRARIARDEKIAHQHNDYRTDILARRAVATLLAIDIRRVTIDQAREYATLLVVQDRDRDLVDELRFWVLRPDVVHVAVECRGCPKEVPGPRVKRLADLGDALSTPATGEPVRDESPLRAAKPFHIPTCPRFRAIHAEYRTNL
ncbi:hypothetical protein [Embleya sp. NPDC059237]|uniref:hypothetical protein n=1 Tax=Embleya sp. NPDC059237 TaxID=3346784 RepID=UPI003679E358